MKNRDFIDEDYHQKKLTQEDFDTYSQEVVIAGVSTLRKKKSLSIHLSFDDGNIDTHFKVRENGQVVHTSQNLKNALDKYNVL